MANLENLDWDKGGGLLPAIIQDADTRQVLMLGYMNSEALERTQAGGLVTFFSRSRQELWTKGETSGNTLSVVSVTTDCDRDTILVEAIPVGPICHKGTQSCFGDQQADALYFLNHLARKISTRRVQGDQGASYTAQLFAAGPSRIAQKVGEEGLELALAHTKGDLDETRNEAADLLYHFLILLEDAGLSIGDICELLKSRSR